MFSGICQVILAKKKKIACLTTRATKLPFNIFGTGSKIYFHTFNYLLRIPTASQKQLHNF